MKRSYPTLDGFIVKKSTPTENFDVSSAIPQPSHSCNEISSHSSSVKAVNDSHNLFDIGKLLKMNVGTMSDDMKLNYLMKTWTPEPDFG
jgi:hypothetical protein